MSETLLCQNGVEDAFCDSPTMTRTPPYCSPAEFKTAAHTFFEQALNSFFTARWRADTRRPFVIQGRVITTQILYITSFG
jgi:hypothetical protein